MGLIQWTDTEGTQTLHNDKPGEGSRFANWNPKPEVIGPGVNRLSDALLHKFRFRTDNLVTFEIRGIPNYFQERALRLMEHLGNGGYVTVITGDAVGAVYPNCSLAPDSEPDFVMSDADMIEYTLSVSLVGPSRFLNFYGGTGGGGSSGDSGVPPSLIQLIDPSILIGQPGIYDGSLVNSVTDPIGGYNVAQLTTPTARPTFLEDMLNGYPALEFSNDDWMTSPIVMTPTDGATLFLVAERSGLHVEHGTFFRMASNPTDETPGNDNYSRLAETHGGDIPVTYDDNKLKWVSPQIMTGEPDSASHLTTVPFVWAMRIINNTQAIQHYNGYAYPTFDPYDGLDGPKALRLGTGVNGRIYRWEWHAGQSATLVSERTAFLRARYGI